MEKTEHKTEELRTESPPIEDSEHNDNLSRREPVVIARPDFWSVFGRPVRRLFRSNCPD